MAEITATVAIPSYNRAQQLKQALACMTSQETNGNFEYEVLVIDDGSTDETPDVVEEVARESKVPVRYVKGRGMGYTHALNTAVSKFNGKWLAFFDDDQLTHSKWLSQLLSAASNQGAMMVGGPIELELPRELLDAIGPVCRNIFGEYPPRCVKGAACQAKPLPPGGNRLVHRSVFEKIGSFDEKMLTGGCDRDFLLRACDAGITMGWAERAVVRHLIDPSRFTPEHIKWYSLQWGCSFAYIDRKRWGRLKTTLACIARIGQALMVNLPLYLYFRARDDRRSMMDYYALLWRCLGYTRQTLRLLMPRVFAQEDFFSKVEFRRIRKTSNNGSNLE
ncbi:MAG: glycosyltransferase [Thermodesulfobacteria bacterium]|nr:glycosyltransferase [Thermodesulfobacteriota bacterium]